MFSTRSCSSIEVSCGMAPKSNEIEPKALETRNWAYVNSLYQQGFAVLLYKTYIAFLSGMDKPVQLSLILRFQRISVLQRSYSYIGFHTISVLINEIGPPYMGVLIRQFSLVYTLYLCTSC